MTASRVVCALDLPDFDQARAMALRVGDAVGMVKIGLELFVAEGPRAVAIGEEAGVPVFLDLKLHDIPETVERAVGRAAALGVRVLTVHASGGRAMLRRAVQRAEKEGRGTQIAAVTVLTSFDASDLADVGFARRDVEGQVCALATLAWEEGVRTFVCSPHEARAVRRTLGEGATLITPGVRAEAAAGKDDQKRVMTAREAVEQGADWVVVGRPIRDAADPRAAAAAIARDVAEARRA